MSQMGTILVCNDARGHIWQVSKPVSGKLALIGWHLPLDSAVEGGPPESVVALLSGWLTDTARISFLCSDNQGLQADDARKELKASGLNRLLDLLAAPQPGAFSLVSTRSAQTARRLFADGGFPWWMQGQVVLISGPDSAPPDLDRKTTLSLVDRRVPIDFGSLSAQGIVAVLAPGVDGDVAGLLSSGVEWERRLLSALAEYSARASFTYRMLSEDAFSDSLAAAPADR